MLCEFSDFSVPLRFLLIPFFFFCLFVHVIDNSMVTDKSLPKSNQKVFSILRAMQFSERSGFSSLWHAHYHTHTHTHTLTNAQKIFSFLSVISHIHLLTNTITGPIFHNLLFSFSLQIYEVLPSFFSVLDIDYKTMRICYM